MTIKKISIYKQIHSFTKLCQSKNIYFTNRFVNLQKYVNKINKMIDMTRNCLQTDLFSDKHMSIK